MLRRGLPAALTRQQPGNPVCTAPCVYRCACRGCAGEAQAIAMLVVTLVLLVVLAVALFARSWDFGHGPGIMSKLKILLSHFQAGRRRGRRPGQEAPSRRSGLQLHGQCAQASCAVSAPSWDLH